jgi:preprotein translocase subunit YajC
VLISNAYAQTAGAATDSAGGLLAGPLPMLVVMGIAMYFIVFRPQMRRAKEHKLMLEALSKGDDVITHGGIVGKVVAVQDDGFVKLAVASNVEILVQKPAITTVLVKGILKNT